MLLYRWWILNVLCTCFHGNLTWDFKVTYIPFFLLSVLATTPPILPAVSVIHRQFHLLSTWKKVEHEYYYIANIIGEKKKQTHNIYSDIEPKSTSTPGFLTSSIETCNFNEFWLGLQMKFRLWCSYLTHEVSRSCSVTIMYEWQDSITGSCSTWSLVIHGCGTTSMSNNLSCQSKILSNIDLTSDSCITGFLTDSWAPALN